MSDPFKTDDIFKKSLEAKHIRTRRDKVIRKKDREIKTLEAENTKLKDLLRQSLPCIERAFEVAPLSDSSLFVDVKCILNGDKDEL